MVERGGVCVVDSGQLRLAGSLSARMGLASSPSRWPTVLARVAIKCLRWHSFLKIGKQLTNLWGPGTVQWHNFSGKSDSVFREYAVPPAITRGTTGGTLPDTNPLKGFVKRGVEQ